MYSSFKPHAPAELSPPLTRRSVAAPAIAAQLFLSLHPLSTHLIPLSWHFEVVPGRDYTGLLVEII